MAAARALAWFSHVNFSSPTLYAARRDAARALCEALTPPLGDPATVETAFVIKAARVLAGCSFANRWGAPYYERKDAFARLRGALFALDERAAGR